MAQLRRIQRGNPLSSFADVQNPGPNAFDLLADAAQSAFQILDPIATEQAEMQGLEQGAGAVGPYQQPDLPQGNAAYAGLPGEITITDPGSPDAGDPRGGAMPTGASVSRRTATQGARINVSPHTGRPMEPLLEILSRSAAQVFGEGTTVNIGSGHEGRSTGTRRHPAGTAADFTITLPSGETLGYMDPTAEGSLAGEFMRVAAANGIRGIGYGRNYMGGAFHMDIFEPDPSRGEGHVWSEAANVPGLLGIIQASAGGAPVSYESRPAVTQGAGGPQVVSGQVQIRTEQGNLEMRPADLFTTRYDRIRQTAAAGAYTSRILLDAETDLAELQRRFPLDPAGFSQAAEEYVRQMVGSAPEMLRPALRMDLEAEARRSLNGIRAAQHSDVMNRAANASGALVDRYQERYINALASGDAAAADEALANLTSQLRYRESLPGLSWTGAQSENLISAAQREAQTVRTQAASQRSTEIGSMLTDIRQVAAEGRRHTDEAILQMPDVQAHPDYERTVAAVNVREMYPDLRSMSVAQLDALIAEERGRAIGETWENDYLDALTDTRSAIASAWQSDPIGYAASDANRLRIQPLTMFDGTNPQQVVSSLRVRGQQVAQLVEAGYMETPRFFSDAEVEQWAPLLAADAAPEIRAGFAAALIQGFGAAAPDAAVELGAERSTAGWMATAMATNNMQHLGQALTGAAMRRAGQARTVPVETRMSPEAMQVLEALPPNAGVREVISEMALDYTAFSEGMEPADAATFAEAMQMALGRGANGGGVQEVFGTMTLLPPDTTPQTFERAISTAVDGLSGARIFETEAGVFVAPNLSGGQIRQMARVQSDQAALAELLSAAPGVTRYESREEAEAAARSAWGARGVPMVGGEPLQGASLRAVRFEPVMRNGRVVSGLYYGRGPGWDVTDEAGNLYVFDLPSLMDR